VLYNIDVVQNICAVILQIIYFLETNTIFFVSIFQLFYQNKLQILFFVELHLILHVIVLLIENGWYNFSFENQCEFSFVLGVRVYFDFFLFLFFFLLLDIKVYFNRNYQYA